MINLNLLFNKTYYEYLGTPRFEEETQKCNHEIFNATFDHERDYLKSPVATETFVLKTGYPGMLIGTGNPHGGLKKRENTPNDDFEYRNFASKNDINLGFSFDYVTGQPFIPGSTVKGVLRSHFQNHAEAVKEILLASDIKNTDVAEIEKELFDGNDVFLDAVVFDSDHHGKLLCSDYFTPHPDPTKNPVPLLLIKILPNVRFEFRFILHDGSLTKSEKENLFSTLIQLFGIGAKTNVGYGYLEECDTAIHPKTAYTPSPARNNYSYSKKR